MRLSFGFLKPILEKEMIHLHIIIYIWDIGECIKRGIGRPNEGNNTFERKYIRVNEFPTKHTKCEQGLSMPKIVEKI